MGLVVCGESVGGWLPRIGDRVVVVVAGIYTPLIDRYIVLSLLSLRLLLWVDIRCGVLYIGTFLDVIAN